MLSCEAGPQFTIVGESKYLTHLGRSLLYMLGQGLGVFQFAPVHQSHDIDISSGAAY